MDNEQLQQKIKELGEDGARQLLELIKAKQEEKQHSLHELSTDEVRKIYKGHVHEYRPMVSKAPTCTEEGVMLYECGCAEEPYTEPIPMIPHDYKATTVTEQIPFGVVTQQCAWYNASTARNKWSLQRSGTTADTETSNLSCNLTIKFTLDKAITMPISITTNLLSSTKSLFGIFVDGTVKVQINGKTTNQNGKGKYSWNIDIPAGEHTVSFQMLNQDGSMGRYVFLDTLTQNFQVANTSEKQICSMCGAEK